MSKLSRETVPGRAIVGLAAEADRRDWDVQGTATSTGTGTPGPKGDKGDQGLPGPAGMNGAAGSQIYTGSGVPSSGVGTTGDFYLNTANGDYYHRTSGGWGSAVGNLTGPQGLPGTNGTNGANGSLIYTGPTDPPPSGTGANTDLYFVVSGTGKGNVYQKLAGAWTFEENIIGPAGPAGSAPDASATVKGITRLSVNPVTATIPIAVGDNDPRLTGYFAATAAHTMTNTENFITADGSSGSYKIILPDTAGTPAGKLITVVKINSSANIILVFTANSGQVIKGPSQVVGNVAYLLTTQMQSVQLACDGNATWYVV